jgi:isoquinoline 1-oxidoreductase beta subunit
MGTTINRREFLKSTLATSSVLVIGLNGSELMAAGQMDKEVINPFIAIDEQGKVTVVIKHFEMGQGTTTGLSTLIADELDASWEQIDITFAPADNERYKNLFWGIQGTGGSSAMANSFMQYRQAGAMARDLLVRAAAKAWDVPVSEVSINEGILTAGSKSGHFGDFVGLAKTLTPNDQPRLKKANEFKLIGKQQLSRKDNPGKVNGTATFAMDISLP